RVVTARALQLALADRHVAGAHQGRLLLQMAAGAQLELRLRQQRLRRRALRVGLVALHAHDAAAVVGGARPVLLPALRVARLADGRRLVRRQRLELLDRAGLAFERALEVRARVAVARLAALLDA